MYSEKFSKKSIKPRRNLLPVMLQAFFIRKILEGTQGESKGTGRAFEGHLGTQDTLPLEHLRHLSARQ